MHYCADRMPAMIFIGMETESGVTEIRFDVSSWLGRWPGMAISLLAATPGGSVYPPLAALEGSELVWRVTDADTSVPGSGRIELVGTLEGIRKISASAATQIQPRLPGTAGDAPDPSQPWVDSVLGAAERITGMQVATETLAAGSVATAEWDGEAGLLTLGIPRGATSFEVDETLTLENGVLSVNRAEKMEKDNSLPITSAAVYTEVGNINALLETI